MLKHGLKLLLLGAVSCGAVWSQAQAPQLKINGFTSMGAIAGKQSNRGNDKGGSPAEVQVNCAELGFTVAGMSASGLEYKYRVVMETIPNIPTTISKNYVEFGGDFGVIQGGTVKGPEDTMIFNALNLVGGGGGIDGSFSSVYNMSSGVIDGVEQSGHSGKANKLVFYSPIVSGFQLGVAYTPEVNYYGGKSDKNTNNRAIAKDIYLGAKANGPRGRNNWSIGLKYNAETGAWTYGTAAVWIKEQNYMNIVTPASVTTLNRYKLNSTNTYSLSAFFGRDNWKLAAGWMDNGKSRLPRDTNITYMTADKSQVNLGNTALGNAGKAWNLGGQYTLGAYEMALTYFNTNRKTDAVQKATSDVVTCSLDYKALEGLKFFGEVDIIRSKTNQDSMAITQASLGATSTTRAVGSNSGTIMVAGTKISF